MKDNDVKTEKNHLFSILQEHQLWVLSNGKNGRKADLSGANLTGKNLRDANLKRADLSGADLSKADLSGANLRGADLTGADLTDSNLTKANLTTAILKNADLTRARLNMAILIKTDLRGVNLNKAFLNKTDLEGANFDAEFLGNFALSTDHLQKQLQSSETTIRNLQEKLNQAELNTVKNDGEITKLEEQLNLEKSEKQKITEKLEELNNLLNKRKEELRGRIKDAQKSLSEALKNTDKQIKNNEASASCFSGLGIGLFSLAIVLLIFFSMAVLFHPEYISEKKLNILFYTFPIITLMLIGTTCLRHQKNLLTEVRHFSNMKHQIELYSGLLEASQHAAVSFNNPEKANEYVQETFTQIRNRLLNSQYLPDNSSADKQSDNDLGSDKVLDLLNKIADLSGKKSMGN
ncbi:pentapeptide repeat-containing protein [Neisseria elongata]|jgi:hypothetical protein|uniref:pentapeptide repeat-containing protein n=1 Tax=Neisseria elongata TaxID=495 RepID=UPI001959E521|nr:pentapeptide repeat-containing protein [Neisseria elongata]MBM7064118.1 pentapeptide repeat-containing protein [Neisseria elongata]